MIRQTALSAALGALLAAGPADADGFRLRTEFGLNVTGAGATAVGAGARAMWDGSSGPFRYQFHATVHALHGSAVAQALANLSTPRPPATLFNLSGAWSPNPTTLVLASVDRAWVSFSTDTLVLKLGRQAITWGSGTVFHPSDIVAPFSPLAIDTSYKPGVDMLYAQYLFDSGADIQAIAVPRAAPMGGPVRFDQSTFAIRASASTGEVDGALMFARDRGDSVAGISLSGPLGGASWNAEYVHWWLASGTTHPSWLVNIANFGTLGDWNISYFAEYFHNGFGVSPTVPVDALPASLANRMATGQVFFGGRDFLALGGMIQMTPDLSMSPSAIVSLNDGSALAGIGINYSLGDNTDLSFNYFHPFGAAGTEFGGRETSAGSGILVGPARSATLRLVHFF